MQRKEGANQERAICHRLRAWAEYRTHLETLVAMPEGGHQVGRDLPAEIPELPGGHEKARFLPNIAKEVLANVSLAAMKAKGEVFQKYLNQGLNHGASWARRFTGTWEHPEPSLRVEVGPDGLELTDPESILCNKKPFRWAEPWKGTAGSEMDHCPEWLRNLRARDRGQQQDNPLPELTFENMAGGMRYFKAHAGLGADPWK
eukprot:3005231-Pyramimonas_sp.AAC.1